MKTKEGASLKLSARISLLSMVVTTTFGTMMAAPAVKLLAVAFPDTNALLVQWVVTLSSLFILPTLFLAGKLGRRFSRKSILIAGLSIYVIGGVGPAFAHSFNMILAYRAILGLSIGLISPTLNALIAENFQGKERSRMNGIQTSVNGIGGAIFLSLGGFIASLGWREVFLTYLYAILLLVFAIAFLPQFPPSRNENSSIRGSVRFPRSFYAVAAAGGLHAMLFSLIPSNLSLFVTNYHISSVTSVGYLTACALIGVFVGGLTVTRLSGVFKKLLVPLDIGLMALGFLMISSAHTAWAVALSVFLIGLSEGMLFPLSFIKTAEVVPKQGLTAGISLLLGCIYACQFLSPLFVQGVELLIHTRSTRGVFMALAVALAVIAFVYLPFLREKKRAAEDQLLNG